MKSTYKNLILSFLSTLFRVVLNLGLKSSRFHLKWHNSLANLNLLTCWQPLAQVSLQALPTLKFLWLIFQHVLP